MSLLYIATEDELSQAVAERLISEANQDLSIAIRMGLKGNGYLRKKIHALNRLSQSIPVLLMTDLDNIDCPPTLISDWLGDHVLHENMLFRVAVKEVEAWLIADRDGFADFASAPRNMVPFEPELLNDPKQTLLTIVNRYADREIKTNLLPARGSSAQIGFGYNIILSRFVRGSWSVQRARNNSPSLDRAFNRLRELGLRQVEN